MLLDDSLASTHDDIRDVVTAIKETLNQEMNLLKDLKIQNGIDEKEIKDKEEDPDDDESSDEEPINLFGESIPIPQDMLDSAEY